MVDFSFIVSLYVSDLPNVTISTGTEHEASQLNLFYEYSYGSATVVLFPYKSIDCIQYQVITACI